MPSSPLSPSGARTRNTESARASAERRSYTDPGAWFAGRSCTCALTRGSSAVSAPTLAPATVPLSFMAVTTGTLGCW